MLPVFKRILLIVIVSSCISQVYTQETERQIRIGFDFGLGSQQVFPFNDPYYFRATKGYKLQISYPFRFHNSRFSYELLLEPSFYLARQQLLYKPYVTEKDWGPDYLQLREIYSTLRTIDEYALNIGFLSRYNVSPRFSTFLLVSTGPFYGNQETERLAKGFAFSDVVAIGSGYIAGKFRIELRFGLRHVSNLGLHFPNAGHNTSTIDLGLTYSLKKLKQVLNKI